MVSKWCFITVLLFLCGKVAAQPLFDTLKTITTCADAERFVKTQSEGGAVVVRFNSLKDTLAEQAELYKHRVGDTFAVGAFVYKVIRDTSLRYNKMNYHFYSRLALTDTEVDSVITRVMVQYKSGVTFQDIFKCYDCENFASFDWFSQEEAYPPVWKAVEAHKVNDLFVVHAPELGGFWYIRKMCSCSIGREVTLLGVMNLNPVNPSAKMKGYNNEKY